jgi:hypothetical protein
LRAAAFSAGGDGGRKPPEQSFPPPTFCERRHRGLARRLVAPTPSMRFVSAHFGAQTGRCRGPCQLKTSQQQASQWLEAAAFAGHSLRAGFVTSAVKRGANLIKITDVTGHRSLEMLKTYSRDAEAFVGHAGAGLL